jgi:hypothetical protein
VRYKDADNHENNLNLESQELAIPALPERICDDAQPILDAESINHFCQTWAEVGRAILLRRKQQV